MNGMWDGDVVASGYRAWIANGAPGQDFLELTDAASECQHGTLPTDRVRRCDCFGRTAPDLIPDIRTEETLMTPEPVNAPYGFKADGVTPRKRPAPSPERVAKMHAARGKKAAKPKPVPALPNRTGDAFIDRMVADFDAEIARLQSAREALLKAAKS